jgi:hypothetical protein
MEFKLKNDFNTYIDECSVNLKDLKLNVMPQLEEAIVNINKCFSRGGKIIFLVMGDLHQIANTYVLSLWEDIKKIGLH